MILRGDGDFADASTHGAGGIAHGGAEQFGQCDERHGPVSPRNAIAISSSITASNLATKA
jgi:hypothetical protein